MRVRLTPWLGLWLLVAAGTLLAQESYTWQQLRDKFVATNPSLQAARIGIDESRAQEVTAYLRPNPDFSESTDGTQLTPYRGVYQPFPGTQFVSSISYLHERDRKRELRRESAQKATAVTMSEYADQERTLLFTLRGAFLQALQQKAILAVARESLAYYNRLVDVSSERLKAGDISRIEFKRLELQRVQFETDVQTALVNLRTAKIQLLALLNDRTPVEQFDVTGPFDFAGKVPELDQLRNLALQTRPDLRAAMQAVDKAQTDHLLALSNGSTDPTFSGWWTHNPSFNNPYDNNTVGASISIPLRIFDRNQGEKLRTEQDITRAQRQQDAARAQVFSDVDSAYAALESNLTLLRPYKTTYLQDAVDVRETVSFAYTRGGASLLDFLQAQQDYRSTQLNYLNLVGAFLTAGAQLNLAVGREVIP
ncbi:MAG TPA: TolC family protein [Bryobacteraceae bacterium]|nr:TolC family protein [Bryobacteraceae bacterium]